MTTKPSTIERPALDRAIAEVRPFTAEQEAKFREDIDYCIGRGLTWNLGPDDALRLIATLDQARWLQGLIDERVWCCTSCWNRGVFRATSECIPRTTLPDPRWVAIAALEVS